MSSPCWMDQSDFHHICCQSLTIIVASTHQHLRIFMYARQSNELKESPCHHVQARLNHGPLGGSFGRGQERITGDNQLIQINILVYVLDSIKPSPVFFASTLLIPSSYVGSVWVPTSSWHLSTVYRFPVHFGSFWHLFCRESPTTADLSEQCQGFQGQARRNCTNQLCMPPRIISECCFFDQLLDDQRINMSMHCKHTPPSPTRNLHISHIC